ncbi:cytochrome P450 [Aspergillus vadensis CBS 113365]|uniref:Cytochrome P450 monooxygenase n=1 Tax=Aspergillus vadensis (strain CBS 113365 / IMI 142717 / IBT 24658) TaxID=1448311 RepID=A0A319B092_ASPVC|nr:cytochrome P450 monooxygenase [Aspergillus vadensis CBS 113365]PYH65111.1 cytochrome P450 monooxygenase [Aspergillus vadensis CBS 113365]
MAVFTLSGLYILGSNVAAPLWSNPLYAISPVLFAVCPKYATIFPLWYAYALLRGNFHEDMRHLHAHYGPVVRYAPNELSYTDPRAWTSIYSGRPTGTEFPELGKDPTFYAGFASGNKSITTAGFHDHNRFRKKLAPAFAEKSIREQEPIIKGYVDLFVQQLEQRAGEVVDMSAWFNVRRQFCTFDIIGDLGFGEPFGSLKTSMLIQISARFPGLQSLLLWYLLPAELARKRLAHIAKTTEKVVRRLGKETDRKDFMQYLSTGAPELSFAELANNSSTLIVAGSETSATSLAAVTFYLLKNPEKMRKLRQEIETAFGVEEEITIQSVAGLKYLTACLEEGWRLYPPIPSGLPRQVPGEGFQIAGRWVPGGAAVSVHSWATSRSPKNFRNPDKFIPERWLGEPSYKDDNLQSVQVFHVGPRNCIGKSLAYAEMRLILARLLFRFDLQLMPHSSNWAEQMSYMVWERGPLDVRVTERNASDIL